MRKRVIWGAVLIVVTAGGTILWFRRNEFSSPPYPGIHKGIYKKLPQKDIVDPVKSVEQKPAKKN